MSLRKTVMSTVARDGLADHRRESYVCETGKSMKAREVRTSHKDLLAKNRDITYSGGRSDPSPVNAL